MEQIGRYTILGELGRGGFGIVYKAQDPKINRIVAIKTIPTQELRSFAGGKELYERFSREAQSAGSLSHPNIVTVFELAEDDAVTYIVMEFVPGRSLRDVMSDGTAIPVERKLSLIRQMAEALDFAHENGIIHRDVKPANILVTDAGVAKIADFGVAKIVSQHTMSATGVAVGTPSYMSPEQIMAKGVDGRSDQFSLAVIAYELLTGKQPFDGDSLPALIHQILSIDPPDPATVSEQVERPGSDVLLRGLAKRSGERYPTCVAFSDALRRAVINKEITVTLPTALAAPVVDVPVAKPNSSPLVKAGLAIGLGIAVAAVFIVRNGNQQAPPVAPVVAAPEPSKPLATVARAETKKSEPVKSEPIKDAKKKDATVAAAAPPPVVAETRPVEPPDPGPDAPAASYNGPPEGRFSWSGVFGPGERLVIVRNRVRKGSVGGSGLPPGIPLQVEVSPADVQVMQQPNAANGFRLVVANGSGGPVNSFSIVWREVQH
jgi:eukaryotic-like serine/threonine-protein kinase